MQWLGVALAVAMSMNHPYKTAGIDHILIGVSDLEEGIRAFEKSQIAGAPFFIQWGATTTHPSLTSPGGCSLASFQVRDPAGHDLSRLLEALGVKADVRKSDHAHMHLDIRCGARPASFDSP